MGRPKHIRQVGFLLLTAAPTRLLYREKAGKARPLPEGPPPGGIDFEQVVPLVPAAGDAFTPHELSLRILAHARRVEREEPPGESRPHCFACGKVPRQAVWIGGLGWWRRKLRGYPNVYETYCPECFKRWGWGDGERGAA